jgi:hypothetical protein
MLLSVYWSSNKALEPVGLMRLRKFGDARERHLERLIESRNGQVGGLEPLAAPLELISRLQLFTNYR